MEPEDILLLTPAEQRSFITKRGPLVRLIDFLCRECSDDVRVQNYLAQQEENTAACFSGEEPRSLRFSPKLNGEIDVNTAVGSAVVNDPRDEIKQSIKNLSYSIRNELVYKEKNNPHETPSSLAKSVKEIEGFIAHSKIPSPKKTIEQIIERHQSPNKTQKKYRASFEAAQKFALKVNTHNAEGEKKKFNLPAKLEERVFETDQEIEPQTNEEGEVVPLAEEEDEIIVEEDAEGVNEGVTEGINEGDLIVKSDGEILNDGGDEGDINGEESEGETLLIESRYCQVAQYKKSEKNDLEERRIQSRYFHQCPSKNPTAEEVQKTEEKDEKAELEAKIRLESEKEGRKRVQFLGEVIFYRSEKNYGFAELHGVQEASDGGGVKPEEFKSASDIFLAPDGIVSDPEELKTGTRLIFNLRLGTSKEYPLLESKVLRRRDIAHFETIWKKSQSKKKDEGENEGEKEPAEKGEKSENLEKNGGKEDKNGRNRGKPVRNASKGKVRLVAVNVRTVLAPAAERERGKVSWLKNGTGEIRSYGGEPLYFKVDSLLKEDLKLVAKDVLVDFRPSSRGKERYNRREAVDIRLLHRKKLLKDKREEEKMIDEQKKFVGWAWASTKLISK